MFLSKQDNIPFWLHEEESDAFFILEGTLNVYHSKIDSDGNPVGVRSFLFQMLEGELLLSLAPYVREDGVQTGILIIPAVDCELNPAKTALTAAMRPFAEEWIEKCGRRMGYSREKIEATYQDMTQEWFDEFNSSLMKLLDEQIVLESKQQEEVNRRRYAGESSQLRTAIGKLRSVISGSFKTVDITGADPLIAACAAVAMENGIEITIPRSLESSNVVNAIAQASHFRTRDVILSGKWYQEHGGNLLGKLDESGEPVALLQKTPRKYIMYNPTTGERLTITKKVAERISPYATMFYRSLPLHRLTFGEIVSFVRKGSGKSDLLWVGIVALLGGFLGMLVPEITGMIFSEVIPAGDRALLLQIGLLMGAMAITNFALEITRAFAMHRIYGMIERDLQSAVWDRIFSLPISFFKNYSAGELHAKAMSISKIQHILSGTVSNTVISSIFSVSYIIVMFRHNTMLAFTGLIITVITMLICFALGKSQIKYEAEQIENDNKISGRMFGWLSGLAKIKMSGSEKRTFYNWSEMYRQSREITFRKESIGNWAATFKSSVIVISSMLIYWVMFSNIEDAMIPTGAFIAFNAAFVGLLQACIGMSDAFIEANVIFPLFKEAKPIFEAVPEYDDSKSEAPLLTGEIELSHISFAYNQDGPTIINDVSLHIRSGEHVALVGPSGSGKSTLFRILLGFEKPDNGEIYFDKISLSQMDVRSVRRQLGVVLQSGMLLAGSIFENIAGSNPNLSQDDAMRAIKQAGMEEDLSQMPMGLHTVISEGTGTLSGGQRQRLLIARALASSPKMLFFDEATSALDNKTQKIVSDSVNNLRVTRITIAHRLSTVQDCDRIIVLERGRITEEGTYDELMKLNGTFATLARRQMA